MTNVISTERDQISMPSRFPVSRLVALAAGTILMSLIITACSGEPELIGTDMEEQEAPPFTLTDHRGDTVTLEDLRGQAVAMTFIFTNCPDVCPFIINRMNLAYQELPGDKQDGVAMVAVTVDPERDDPETLAAYLETRGVVDIDRWYGLTGDIETLEPIWEAYFVTPGDQYPADPEVQEAIDAGEHDHEAFMEEGPDDADVAADDHGSGHEEDENTAYWLAHTDVIYVIDPDGLVRVLMRSQDSPEDLAHNLEILAP
jgi:cytochrome oxidase Cu insertion factor (SCO1/SenC/PrrC family)